MNVPLLHTSTQSPGTSLYVTSFTKPFPLLVLQATDTKVKKLGLNSVVALLCMWISFRHKQGSKMDIKVTTVELTDMTDSDSKEEQDTATSVDNICYERVPSKLSVSTNSLSSILI